MSKDGVNEVDGKSVLGILTLGAELDHEIVVRVKGPDAAECMEALTDLIGRDFDGV